MSAEAVRPDTETVSLLLPTEVEGNESENVATAVRKKPERTEAQRRFGGLTAQEAGRKSAESRRRKALAQESEAVSLSSGKVVLVRTPVAVGDIIARLQQDAKKGNTQAARELRAYMEMYPADDETDLSALDARTRQQVLARVLAEIVEEEGALPEAPLD